MIIVYEINLIAFFIGVGLQFAIIGLYLTVKAYSLWKRTDDDVLRAKVFLNKQFLHRNFMFVLALGILAAGHLLLEFTDIYELPVDLEVYEQQIDAFYILLPVTSMLLLSLLAYY